jgi:hypothetical protein
MKRCASGVCDRAFFAAYILHIRNDRFFKELGQSFAHSGSIDGSLNARWCASDWVGEFRVHRIFTHGEPSHRQAQKGTDFDTVVSGLAICVRMYGSPQAFDFESQRNRRGA